MFVNVIYRVLSYRWKRQKEDCKRKKSSPNWANRTVRQFLEKSNLYRVPTTLTSGIAKPISHTQPLMSGLKLTVSASIHGALPYKWLRSTSTSASDPRIPSLSLQKLSCRSQDRSTAVRGTLLPAARPQVPPRASHASSNTVTSGKSLGLSVLILRRPKSSQKCMSYFSSSDSDNRGDFVGPKNMVSGTTKSEALSNHDDTDQRAAHRASSPLSMRDADQKSSKLLTLPTILTLGRVAAVPILISSMLLLSTFSFSLKFCVTHVYPEWFLEFG